MANNNKNTNELAMFEDEPTRTLAGQHHLAEEIQRQANRFPDTTADELSRQAGKLACAEEEIEKLRAQLERTEAYGIASGCSCRTGQTNRTARSIPANSCKSACSARRG